MFEIRKIQEQVLFNAIKSASSEEIASQIVYGEHCTAPHFVNTVRQHFVEYSAGNIQPGLNILELNEYGGCYRNLCKPLLR